MRKLHILITNFAQSKILRNVRREHPPWKTLISRKCLTTLALTTIALSFGYQLKPALSEGSRNLYPSTTPTGATRANLEWRTDVYGGLILRRTLLKVYANQGEYILLGSSAEGVNSGNIQIFNPGRVSGTPGKETIPSTSDFQCTSQAGRGFISSRTQELAGPQSIDGTGNTTGYVPCYYQAPSTGVYDVVFYGPIGSNSSQNGNPAADINLSSSNDFNSNQVTTVAAWDVTVRASKSSTSDITGRLFSYYLALFTGNNGLPLYFSIYPVTTDGYQYKVQLRGVDPNAFLVYGNQVGFFDSDGKSPLYHDILGKDGQVSNPNGSVTLAYPQYPTFFNPLDTSTLSFLNRYGPDGTFNGTGITPTPIPPSVSSLSFSGTFVGNTSNYGKGGTFSFNSSVVGNYQIVISRDGISFDPTNPNNKVLRGYILISGSQAVTWNGKDNSGVSFPVGTNYPAQVIVHAGEYHFPLLDAENNVSGGPTITLLNQTNPLGNSTGFYDDRQYTTANGTQVFGTTTYDATKALCGTNPPSTPNSNTITGFDTSSNQRAYGQSGNNGNTNVPCTGSFGDTKGLDLWTFYPSNAATTSLNIVDTQSIIGTLYQDNNADSILDNNEPGLAQGITVRLINSSNLVVATTTTDTNGNYIFTGLSNGNYTIQVDTTNSNIPSGFTLETANNVPATINGTNINNINFGFIKAKAGLILVKRITAINGVSINQYVDDPTTTNDNNSNWPSPLNSNGSLGSTTISSYLKGVINGGQVSPNDDIEYTVYFLSAGSGNASKIELCDLVPANTNFVTTAFNGDTPGDGGLTGADSGIALAINSNTPTAYLTNTSDPGDRGTFYSAGNTATPSSCSNNTNGAVVVDITRSPDLPTLVSGTYGFVRFHAKVK